jgi:hypothetical protein
MHFGAPGAGRVRRVLGLPALRLPLLGLPMLPALPSMRPGLASPTRHLMLPISASRLTRMLRREAAQAPNNAKTRQAVQLPRLPLS